MNAVSSPTRQKSWQNGRQRGSLLAALAIRKETVSRRLAGLREQYDLSQEKAAQKVGVTVRQWQRWEAGASIPYTRNLSAIADAFAIDVAEFFDDDREQAVSTGSPDPVADAQLNRIEQALADALNDRGDQNRRTAEQADRIMDLLSQQGEILERIERAMRQLGVAENEIIEGLGEKIRDVLIQTVPPSEPPSRT